MVTEWSTSVIFSDNADKGRKNVRESMPIALSLLHGVGKIAFEADKSSTFKRKTSTMKGNVSTRTVWWKEEGK